MRKLLLILVLELLVYGSPLRADGVPLDTLTLSSPLDDLVMQWQLPADATKFMYQPWMTIFPKYPEVTVNFFGSEQGPYELLMYLDPNTIRLGCFPFGPSELPAGVGECSFGQNFNVLSFESSNPFASGGCNVMGCAGVLQAGAYAGGSSTLTIVGPSDPPVSTPEPGTLEMLACGLGVLALFSWRRLRLTTDVLT